MHEGLEGLVRLAGGLAGFGLLIAWVRWELNRQVVTRHRFPVLPAGAAPLRLVHLSDLHVYGRAHWYELLGRTVAQLEPHLICITGDLADRRRFREGQVLRVAETLQSIAPVFMASGNHEVQSGRWETLAGKLETLGVTVLRDRSVLVTFAGTAVRLAGLEDRVGRGAWKDSLNRLADSLGDAPAVLLAHRPERYPVYRQQPWSLILAGHAHGGLVRIGGHGLIMPPQGPWPRYTGGVCGEAPPMVVSRGIGNTSAMPLRLFNPPEILLIELCEAK